MQILPTVHRRVIVACLGVALMTCVTLRGQTPPPKDTLRRETPRGTLLGFMDAAREGNTAAAVLYLNTERRDKAAADLVHELYVVLDSRLPARLDDLSDRPEGSLANPLKPGQEIIGTIETGSGPIEIALERVTRGEGLRVWLFSRGTLAAVPEAYAEIDRVSVDRYLPQFLVRPRIAGIRLAAWLALLLVVPLLYRAVAVAGLVFRPLVAIIRRRNAGVAWATRIGPGPIRLFALAVLIRWIVSMLELPLLERQFWAVIEKILATIAAAWLLLMLNGAAEQSLRRQLSAARIGEMTATFRLARRAADVLVIAAAMLVMLRVFGLDPTAALAGLGIGGIAVALAAQKTLENVVGGLSIVFDKAVRVGDTLKVGETVGTVDFVGLRSTRIRTPDRTIVSVPNGQIANVNIETLSARDKYRFIHVVALRHDTTAQQIRAVVQNIQAILAGCPGIDQDLIRVRFFRFGSFSLDVEVFAYIYADGWEGFLETQQDLLLRILEAVERCGTAIALPPQTLRVTPPSV